MMKRLFIYLLPLLLLCSFSFKKTLKGVWEYSGGVYNGKADSAAKDYKLHREYDSEHYQAFLIDGNESPVVYERGDYQLKKDTCMETQTYSSQPSKVTGITIKYHYQIKNDTLTFTGILPNGTTVKEYWKKVK